MTEKGFRPGQKEKVFNKIKESLTPEEAQRIEEQRKFDSLKPGTFDYKLALHLDMLKQAMRDEMTQINRMLNNISLQNNDIGRCEEQLKSGVITHKLDNDLVMNEKEIKTHIEHSGWLRLNEVRAIARAVLKIRGYVGHKDIALNPVLTKDEYDEYVKYVREQLKERGHDLFD